jgi:hypothetical protein
VWNTPREGFPGFPVKAGMEHKATENLPNQLKVTFVNTGTDPAFKEAELFYDESGNWGQIGYGKSLIAYSYVGHKVS